METKVVTIRHNHALVKLSLMAGKTIDEVADRILSCLFSEDLIDDIPEVCGLTLEYLLDQNDTALEVFGTFCFHKCTERLLSILKGIQIWGLVNDCEICGHEMRHNDISEHKECKNDTCGWSINMNNEPDPDEGRDDCKMSNPMLLPYLKTYNLN